MTSMTKYLSSVLFLALAFPAQAGQDVKAVGTQERAKPAEAAAVQVNFTVSVKGLEEAKASKVESSLIGLMRTVYECEGCGHEEAKPGTCCEADLKKAEHPLLSAVAANVEKGAIDIRVAPGSNVRLSQIENALRANSVNVDRENLSFGADAAFVYQGGASADDAKAVQKAFQGAEFARALAVFDPETKEVQVRCPGCELSWPKVVELGAGMEKPLRLTDAIWGVARLKSS